MILQVFDKIRNYQITYYYNMLILSQMVILYYICTYKRSSGMKKNKIYDNRLRSESVFLNCRAKGRVIAFSQCDKPSLIILFIMKELVGFYFKIF